MYKVIYTPRAKKDMKFWEKNSQRTLKKIRVLINEISEHPREGSGKPEMLSDTKNTWSRRINRKDRITYQIFDNYVYVHVLGARGHYDDH